MRKLLIASGLAAFAALVGLLGFTSFGWTVEMKAYDWRVQLTARPERARPDIVMVTIDEDSIAKLEPQVGRWPWPRLTHAALIDYLARGPAKVVAYDVLFSERDLTSFKVQGETWTGRESDDAFVESVRRAGNVVLAADASPEAYSTRPTAAQTTEGENIETPDLVSSPYRLAGPLEERPIITPPFKGLGPAARQVASVFNALDPDGPLRRMAPFIRVNGRAIPSLGVAAAIVAAGLRPDQVRIENGYLLLGGSKMPLITERARTYEQKSVMSRRALVRYNGPEVTDSGRLTYQEYSFFKLFYSELQLQAGQPPLVDPALFRGKVVVVGTTATATHDLFAVPFAKGDMPGMEVHVNVIDNILSNRFLAPAPGWLTALSIAIAASLIALLAVFTTAWWTIGGGLALVGATASISTVLFGGGLWLPALPAMMATVGGAFGGVAYQYFIEGREKRRIKRVFSRMVAPDVYAHLLSDPKGAVLGGERRDMAVLFSDIRGFTTLTEAGRAEDVVAQLNEYFTVWVDVLFRHKGTVDKFVGDMVMSLFSAPLDDGDAADHAVQAALEMVRTLDTLNARWATEGRPQIHCGVGINSGEMIAGMIGSEQMMSYTVIGDAVNLGSRLESLNKQYGTTIIISESTRERLKGQYHTRALGEVTVKGKTRPVTIYEVQVEGAEAASGVAAPHAETGL